MSLNARRGLVLRLTLLFFFFAGPVFAQTSPPDAKPTAAGRPHICPPDRYPLAAIQVGAQGKTTLTFVVTAAGTVANIAVKTSSGNIDLDNAAISCASEWIYNPGTKNGVAIDTPWGAMVSWSMPNYAPIPPSDDANSKRMSPIIAELVYGAIIGSAVRDCTIAAAPAIDLDGLRHATTFDVLFSQGRVSKAHIIQSSGNLDLDERAFACMHKLPSGLGPGESEFPVKVIWGPNSTK